MRTLLITAMLALMTVLSGCADEGSGSGSSDDDVPSAPTNATALEPLHWEADVLVGADPFNFLPNPANPTGGNLPPCSQAISGCDKYDFTVPEANASAGSGNGSVSLVATLKWGLAANDFDLYLYQGTTELSSDGINGIPPAAGVPPTTQVLRHGGLAPGTYSFWVVAWNAVNDSYTLDVDFPAE